MKIRFYLFLFVSFALVSFDGFAQSMRYGLTMGLQLSHPKEVDARLGFNIGGKGEISFSKNESHVFGDFGLMLSAKGWSDDLAYATSREYVEWKCRLYYLEVPIHIGYKYAVSEKIKILAGFGPYFAIGLLGRSEFDCNGNTSEITNPYDGNLFKNGTYKCFDFGVDAKAGIEANRNIQVFVGYELSLMSPTKERWKILSLKDRTFSISVAYLF